jgi:UPF0755 protein
MDLLLQSGKSIIHSLTIPEGLTVVQALRRVADTRPWRRHAGGDAPEGSLAADTQRFTRGIPRKEVVATMLCPAAGACRGDLGHARARSAHRRHQRVRDAGLDRGEGDRHRRERPHVASVFVNRLRKKHAPSVGPDDHLWLFGGEGKPADRPIYQSDIEKPTPYNTYVDQWLPPGPIANPGRAALEAVANPSRYR